MTRTLIFAFFLLAAPLGCGETPASHRVQRTLSDETNGTEAGDARTKPPRAIATH
ncbi:hypothetical protein [Singulisphaera acidiphila]|uniref:hypothetical protein n=1 Tax=Singulisphaera acidiphila TaxID=466153 RepID=UPI0012B59446|nr:hypothetical protein [Singulisphaera acidiphila]